MSDISVPSSTWGALRREIDRAGGPGSSRLVLQRAGFEAGRTVAHAFGEEIGSEPATLPEARFWDELDAFFSARGWGHLRQERVHPAFGMVRTRGWGEGEEPADGIDGAPFTAGLLARLLGAVAEHPIGVLDVSDLVEDREGPVFLLGSDRAIHILHELLAGGRSLDEALAEL